jgi:hypothetical protein
MPATIPVQCALWQKRIGFSKDKAGTLVIEPFVEIIQESAIALALPA